MDTKTTKQQVFCLAWQFVKQNGLDLSNALKMAWQNIKLKIAMTKKIVKFYFQKIDGSIREAYGTLQSSMLPTSADNDRRAKNNTIQVYFDTEKQEFRCFKKANLINVIS